MSILSSVCLFSEISRSEIKCNNGGGTCKFKVIQKTCVGLIPDQIVWFISLLSACRWWVSTFFTLRQHGWRRETIIILLSWLLLSLMLFFLSVNQSQCLKARICRSTQSRVSFKDSSQEVRSLSADWHHHVSPSGRGTKACLSGTTDQQIRWWRMTGRDTENEARVETYSWSTQGAFKMHVWVAVVVGAGAGAR